MPQISAIRRVMVVSSIALKKAISRLPSSWGVASASSGVSTGTSRTRVTSSFETRMRSTFSGSVSASRRLGCLISPARASSVSRSPYSTNELGGGLHPDAGRAGHVVGRIAGERLDVDDLVRPDAEIFHHLLQAEAPLLARACDPGLARSRVVHRHARLDELHQVLVGGDDQHVGAGFARLAGVGGDEVVGLVAVLLDRDHAEGAHGRAHQRELRHEIVRRIGPVGLVGG